jgi:uncharacterized lipoprotein NlpE involved in copper resistance
VPVTLQYIPDEVKDLIVRFSNVLVHRALIGCNNKNEGVSVTQTNVYVN